MYALTPYPITPIGCFMGVVLTLLPLISHVRKLGLGVWGFALWTAVGNFITFVNSIIWHNNVDIVAPVWCDISTKLQVGAGFGTIASSSVISLHLYRITNRRASIESRGQKRKRVVYELLLVIGFPLLLMGLNVIVQPVRFDIVEEIGCLQTIYSYVGYFIQYVPMFLLCMVCAILAPLTLRTFIRHRKEMDEFLSSGQGITRMVMACLNTMLNLPATVFIILSNVVAGQDSGLNQPFISWKNVHDQAPGLSLSSIVQTPASEWSEDTQALILVKWNEWFFVVAAVVFFAVFGTFPEMRRYYHSALWYIPERLGHKRRRTSELEATSDIAFNSNPNKQQRVQLRHNK
ncbi:fungal pheromone STE3G-protein-coupled receptor [Schizopora paradoxa]|uniref:Fungal pheromone STE3G-protein-coupled receptor n=1 Tax=Schizopora paradoxa TaxID=27342 RepID=A0A0H2RIF6_9AGAM|nr:fungal pheromone STE3G-protein-coupled receptor [Schizopora paradoxa]